MLLRDLAAGAQEVLDAFVRQLEGQDVTLPDRRYASPGVAQVWDGEQFTVHLQQILQGDPGVPSGGTPIPPQARRMHAQWCVTLVRDVSVMNLEGPISGQVPTAEQIASSALGFLGDASALVTAAAAIHSGYVLTKPGQGFVIDSCTPVGPEGGLAATRLLFSISLH